MKNTSKFQNVVIITIVGWLVLFVFLPNLMIIGTSFLTRDDASFVKMVFTLDNYARLLDPLYFEVLLHSLNMALIATLSCLVLGYPFAWFLAKLPEKIRPLLLFLLIVPFWTNSLIRIYGLKIFLSTKGYLNEFLLWLGVIDTPIRIMFTPSAVIIGLVYILLPFMVMPLYSSIEKLDKPLLEAARDLGASKMQTFIRIIIPLTMPGIVAGCLLVMLPAMGLFYVSDLMGGAKNLLIGNVIKVQFLNIRDWPFGAATSITLTIVMGLMLFGEPLLSVPLYSIVKHVNSELFKTNFEWKAQEKINYLATKIRSGIESAKHTLHKENISESTRQRAFLETMSMCGLKPTETPPPPTHVPIAKMVETILLENKTFQAFLVTNANTSQSFLDEIIEAVSDHVFRGLFRTDPQVIQKMAEEQLTKLHVRWHRQGGNGLSCFL